MLRSGELSGPDAPDKIIAFAASIEGLVLLTHDKDFKNLTQQFPEGYRARARRGAGQIILDLPENRARERITDLWLPLLGLFSHAQEKQIRFNVRITATGLNMIDNAALGRTRPPS